MDLKCSKCKELKDPECFSLHRSVTRGRTYVCKKCQKDYWQEVKQDPERYRRRLGQIKKSVTVWRKRNPQKERDSQKAYRVKHRDRLLPINRKRRQVTVKRRREFLAHLKSGPCEDCGKRFPSCAMHFDHLDGNTKSFCLSQKLQSSVETLVAETKKCEVVCANCHAVRTQLRKHLKRLSDASILGPTQEETP